MKYSIALSMAGLVLDMFGVYKIFFTRLKNLGSIGNKGVQLYLIEKRMWGHNVSDNPAFDMLEEFRNELNTIITDTNNNNELAFRMSKKWLYLIIAGFTLQFLSYLIQLLS